MLSELDAACQKLTPLINTRKDLLRKTEVLNAKIAAATQEDNIELMTELHEESMALGAEMDEGIIRLQDTAFEVTADIPISLTESTVQTVNVRRLWRWRVDDIQKLFKKRPDLVTLQPNKEAIDAILMQKKEDGSLDEVIDEITIDGITFFIKA
jgi:hypothetical protein